MIKDMIESDRYYKFIFDDDLERNNDMLGLNRTLYSESDSITEIVNILLELYILNNKVLAQYISKYESVLNCIICNCSASKIFNRDYIRISLGANNFYRIPQRYSSIHVGYDVFMNIIEWLANNNYIDLYKAPSNPNSNISSEIALLDKMKDLINSYDVKYTDIYNPIQTTKSKEVIFLRDSDKKYIDYIDTDETNSRREILNSYKEQLLLNIITIEDELVNDKVHNGCCIYNNDLEYGGRIYRLPWINCNSDSRSTIKINDNSTIEIDIVSCSIQIAHQLNGYDNRTHDYYNIDDYKYDRELVKSIATRMLNMNCSSKSDCIHKVTNSIFKEEVAKAINAKVEEVEAIGMDYDRKHMFSHMVSHNTDRGLLNRFCMLYTIDDIREVVTSVYDKYSSYIEDWILANKGLVLQHYDSIVCFKVIEEFIKLEKVVLTVHDGYIVEEDNKQLLLDTVITKYKEVVGYKPLLK